MKAVSYGYTFGSNHNATLDKLLSCGFNVEYILIKKTTCWPMTTGEMSELSLPQKNSILSVAHDHLCHPSSIDHAISSISTAVHIDPALVKEYLSSLYNLDALFAARAGQKVDGGLESPSKRVKSSPLKQSIRPIEPVVAQEKIMPASKEEHVEPAKDDDENEGEGEEEQDEVPDEMMEDQPEDEHEEEHEEPKRPSRSRRSSSSAAVLPEVLVTPVKRPRRR